jgi:hypothetical protein
MNLGVRYLPSSLALLPSFFRLLLGLLFQLESCLLKFLLELVQELVVILLGIVLDGLKDVDAPLVLEELAAGVVLVHACILIDEQAMLGHLLFYLLVTLALLLLQLLLLLGVKNS